MNVFRWCTQGSTIVMVLSILAPLSVAAQTTPPQPLFDTTTECGRTFQEQLTLGVTQMAEVLKDPRAQATLRQYYALIKPKLDAQDRRYAAQRAALTALYEKKIAAATSPEAKARLHAERDARSQALSTANIRSITQIAHSASQAAEKRAFASLLHTQVQQFASEYAAAKKAVPVSDHATRARLLQEYRDAIKNTNVRLRDLAAIASLTQEQLKYITSYNDFFCGKGLPLLKEQTALDTTTVQKGDAHKAGLADPRIQHDAVKKFEWDTTWSKMILDLTDKSKSLLDAIVQGLQKSIRS